MTILGIYALFSLLFGIWLTRKTYQKYQIPFQWGQALRDVFQYMILLPVFLITVVLILLFGVFIIITFFLVPRPWKGKIRKKFGNWEGTILNILKKIRTHRHRQDQ